MRHAESVELRLVRIDPAGNRLTITDTSQTNYTYDRADRIRSAGSASYTVDANGNLTNRGSDTFSYDQANRLKTATIGGATSSYVYGGDGKRGTKTVSGQTTSVLASRLTKSCLHTTTHLILRLQ